MSPKSFSGLDVVSANPSEICLDVTTHLVESRVDMML
jgi:hypothetical protein